MKKEKIALQLYSVRGDLEKDFYGTIRAVKEIGYAGVEFAGLYGEDPAKVKAFCEELGIVPLSAHVPFQALMADMDGTIAQYKTLGVKYVAIPYLTEDLRPGQPGFQTVIDGMKVIGAKLKVNKDYADRLNFGRKCLMNIASAGKFSSDRTIRQYAEEIWHINPTQY